MVVVFRLAGMDGEATEDRIESLSSETEPTSEKELEKKYSLANVISDNLEGGQTGVTVLLDTLDEIIHLQENKDLTSWLVQLINISIKLKKNRIEFLKNPRTIAIIAKKLFQSVGMHSKFDGKNEQSLFDLILNILEVLIVEQISTTTAQGLVASDVSPTLRMQIDSKNALQESEAVTHVEIFMSLISDECKEMLQGGKTVEETSKKIKSVSKVLPQLIGEEDTEALELVVQLVSEHLKIDKIEQTHASQPNSQPDDIFTTKFYLERIIDILESVPFHKNFIKDAICEIPAIN